MRGVIFHLFSNSTGIIEAALRRFYLEGNTDEKMCDIPEILPIIKEYHTERNLPMFLKEMDVLFIQHHLGPLIPRIRTMIEYGRLTPSKCWFVDIPYSTCDIVRKELRGLRCPENQMVEPFNDPLAPYSRKQNERVEDLMKQLFDQSGGEILIIDDGAYFVRALIHLKLGNKELLNKIKNNNKKIKVVEQTTRGHKFLEKEFVKKFLMEQQITVVSIAQVNTKYNVESPFIGAAVAQEVIEKLEDISRIEKGKGEGLGRVLVLGFGAVGKATTKELVKLDPTQPIEVFDTNKKLTNEINHVKAKPLDRFPKEGAYDTVFGCTGNESINTLEKLKVLADDAMLISTSSAAIEFNREGLIEDAYENAKDDFFVIEPEKARKKGIHAPIHMNLGEKQFSFLNAGFPINFDGTLECVPWEIIQITHGLLFAAAWQTTSSPIGLHKLNLEDDNWFTIHGLRCLEHYAKRQKPQNMI
jgi:hypothetical protein